MKATELMLLYIISDTVISSYCIFFFHSDGFIVGQKKWYTKIYRFQFSCQNLYSILYPECIGCVCNILFLLLWIVANTINNEFYFRASLDWSKTTKTYPILWNTIYLSSFHEIKIHWIIEREKKASNKFAIKSTLKSFSLFSCWLMEKRLFHLPCHNVFRNSKYKHENISH